MNPTRIIPARAGFTHRRARYRSAPRDHPRSRGVYAPMVAVMVFPSGSSPLARGLHPSGRARIRRRGIIPARAGFTTTFTPP